MKFRPKKMPLTENLLKEKEWGWAIVSAIVEGAIVADEAKRGMEYWVCGNPKSGKQLRLRLGAVPHVCSKCGDEINWVDIKTRLIKVCPTCNKQGLAEDTYCDQHVPAVKLQAKEIPL